MSYKGKGKEVASDKRSRFGGGDDGKSNGGGKRKNREVLQFFEDEAQADESDSDFSGFDSMEEDFDTELKVTKDPAKVLKLPFVPKEEEIDEEFDKMMEERYRADSAFVTYEEDGYDNKRSIDRNLILPSVNEPVIWKVKCMVGRERHSAFCLMQKFVDLKSLGNKLHIISAFSVDHVKGFIYIEANKECDVLEACKGLSSIYYTRLARLPKNEVCHLLSVQPKHNEVEVGTWVRVKNGKYKGDLGQIVSINTRKRATVKLIPRIDLQALAQKFGGGVAMKNTASPAPRLISSSELGEFRPLIQIRRDRDTGMVFEVLDGLMLKDGFLYKKVSLDSLSCWGVMPSEDELMKFKPLENNESDNLEWLTQLYGRSKKKKIITNEKCGEKGETSSSGLKFELFDLVCFGRKDYGLIVSMEKDDSYKILKEGTEAPVTVTLSQKELKIGPSDMKFTALDHHRKTVSVNDTVKVLEGSLKDRQGIVKQIYRGTIFIYDENETENGGYFCSKAQMCEKIKLPFDTCGEKGAESGFASFEEFPSSPKSPLSPKRTWQPRDTKSDFNTGDKDGIFSIGQTLRIRVGPLKGYICRVLAVRRSDVTVKLDSKQKVLTVKCEHLSELRSKTSGMPLNEESGSSSFKPFDVTGTEGASTGWMDGAGTSTDGNHWNSGGISAERNSWSSFSASGFKVESDTANQSCPPVDGLRAEDTAWERNGTLNQNSSWDANAAASKAAGSEVDGWGGKEDSWNKAVTNVGSSISSDGWGKAVMQSEDLAGSTRDSGGGWGQTRLKGASSTPDSSTAWDKEMNITKNTTNSWDNVAPEKPNAWGKGKSVAEAESSEKNKGSTAGEDCWNNKGIGWNQQKPADQGTWGKAAEAQDKDAVREDSWSKAARKWGGDSSGGNKAEWKSPSSAGGKQMQDLGDAGSRSPNWDNVKGSREDGNGWNTSGFSGQNRTDSWNNSKPFDADGKSWGKKETEPSWEGKGGSSRGKQEGGSAWNNQDKDAGSDENGGVGGWGGGSQVGQEKTFNVGQSAGWNNEDKEKYVKADGESSGNPSGWGNVQSGGWGKPKILDKGGEDGWNSKWNIKPARNEETTGGWGAGSNWSTRQGSTDDSVMGQISRAVSKESDLGDTQEAGGNYDSSWRKECQWNSGSNSCQNSNWGKSNSWRSGHSDTNKDSSLVGGDRDQAKTYDDREGGGRWQGGFARGRDYSDRGYRGRGNRGSFGGRGDRGGYGGRGDYGGRGRSDRGGFSGRGNSEGGRFGGRGGGYGGRGRGRWVQSNSCNETNNSDEGQASDWKNNGGGWKSNDDGGWRSNDGGGWKSNEGGRWKGNDVGGASSQRDGNEGKWKSWNSGSIEPSNHAKDGSNEGSSWNRPSRADDSGVWKNNDGGRWKGNDVVGSSSQREGNDGKWKSWNSGSTEPSNHAKDGSNEGSSWNHSSRADVGGGWKSNDGERLKGSGVGGSSSQREGNEGKWKSWNSGSTEPSNHAKDGSNVGSSWNNSSRADAGDNRGNSCEGWKSDDCGGRSNQRDVNKQRWKSWDCTSLEHNHSSGWNSQGSGWNKSARAEAGDNGGSSGGGWKNKDCGGSSHQRDGNNGQSKSWNPSSVDPSNQSSGWNSQGGSCWNQPVTVKAGDNGGTGDGWNTGKSSGIEPTSNRGNNWKSSDSTGEGQWSTWKRSSNEPKDSNDSSDGWKNVQSSAWIGLGTDWKKDSGDAATTGNEAKMCNQSGGDGEGQSSTWNESKDSKGGNADAEPNDSWGKAPAGSWSKDGSSKGGW